MKIQVALCFSFALVAVPLGCSVQEEDNDDILRSCTPDWDVVEDASVPCHMDIDKHFFYREAEAYGVDMYMDFNDCIPGPHYKKVLMGTNKCNWGYPTILCAAELWDEIVGGVGNMPSGVYDEDACPGPLLPEGGGGNGSGGIDSGDGVNEELEIELEPTP